MVKLKTSRTLLQLIWKPQVGDRVLLKRMGRPRYATIRDINVAGEALLDWHEEWYRIRHLAYVPRRVAYNQILEKLKIFEWLQQDAQHKYQYKCAVRCPQATIQIEGTSQDVLTKLLDIRVICPKANDAINDLVNQTRGAGAIRFQSVT